MLQKFILFKDKILENIEEKLTEKFKEGKKNFPSVNEKKYLYYVGYDNDSFLCNSARGGGSGL